MPLCATCGEENAPRARFCTTCGAPLGGESGPGTTVRKTVTVVVCDLVDSTALGERLDPEVVRRVVSRYFDEARSTLVRHGGTIEKIIGDAVIAVFGIPTTHEDDALRAVRAALDLQHAIGELNQELAVAHGVQLRIRIGVNTGEVLAGDPAMGQAFATGDPVLTAARLESAAGRGDVLIGEATARLVRHAATLEAVEGGPANAWRAVAIETHGPAVARRLDSPLVGREEELAELVAAFERTVGERRCRVVTLVGEAGVGKSRLATELRRAVAERATSVEGRCPPYGEGVTYWPLAEILRALTGLRPDDPADAGARIAAALPDEPWTGLVAERLAAAVGAGDESGARSDEIAWAFRRLLESVAAERPLVVVLDDIQWAEPTLLDLVEYLAGWSHTAPILVLCLARPDLLERRPSWGRDQGSESLVIRPLPLEDVERLIENLAGRDELDADRVRELARAAAGNPLFVEELLRMRLDERGTAPRPSTYAGAVPASIQAVLAARLDLLGADERAVLQRAAVIGEQFWWSAVAELAAPELASETGPILQTLVRKELVQPDPTGLEGEDGFRFGHMLVREAAYASIPKRTRAALHERFAAWADGRGAGRPAEHDELVGHHLEQAYRYRRELGDAGETLAALAARASERLVRAGRRAFRLGDLAGAAARLQRAAVLLASDDPERWPLLLDAAIARKESGDLAGSIELLDGIIGSSADPRVRASARIERAHGRLMTGEGGADELRAAAEQAVEASGRVGDQSGLAHGWNYVGFELFVRGRFGAMVETLERGREYAVRNGDMREEQRSLAGIANGLLLGPLPAAQAAARVRVILDRVQALAPGSSLGPLAALAGLEAMRGNLDEGWSAYEEAKQSLSDHGQRIQAANLPLAAAPLLGRDPALHERELREAYDLLERAGERGALSTVAAYLAGAVLAQGRGEEAEELTDFSERAASPEDLVSQITWRTVRARALARRGQLDLARELATAARELARRTDSPLLGADALLALAEVELRWGEDLAGEQHAEEALELAAAKGDHVTAGRARTLLESGALDPQLETR